MVAKAARVVLSDDERATLERWVRAPSTEQRLAQRARIILWCTQDLSTNQVAEGAGVSLPTVRKWRSRFRDHRLEGLRDAPRPGRPLVYDHDARLRIVKTVTEDPPDPESHWSMRRVAEVLADEVGVSPSQVWRILKGMDLKPWLTRSWLTSHDPEFWERAADVCGLYLDPPERAVVFSVDERTGMQATSRRNPTKPARPGLVERREFEYRRHGTACLFAALAVHDGDVVAEIGDANTAANFTGFLQRIDQLTPAELEVHIVLDNGSSHRAKATQAWLEAHPRFTAHYTPTHASWLNQVELFFSILGRRLLKRGDFPSIANLTERVLAFITNYNQTARPFAWTYTGKPLTA